MRKIITLQWISLDGFFSGPDEETDWFVTDQPTQDHLWQLFQSVDTILMGKVTYNLFNSYWPTPVSLRENPAELVAFINDSVKIVFSSSLSTVDWNNTELRGSIDRDEIINMKQQPGKNMIIFGSGSVVSRLTSLGLIDEYYFLVNPLFIGKGKTIFKHEGAKSRLRLMGTKTFECGNTLLQFEPADPKNL